MAYFAQLNDSNIVLQVIVVNDSNAPDEATGIAFCKSIVGSDTTWLLTTADKGFRGDMAGTGDWYDATKDQFVPPKPKDAEGNEFTSWTYNYTDYDWDPPIAYPSDSVTKKLKEGGTIDGGKLGDRAHPAGGPVGEYRKIVGGPYKLYNWNESAYQADNSQGWVATGETIENTPDDWTNPDG